MKSSRPVAMWTNSLTSYARTLKLEIFRADHLVEEVLKSRLKINMKARSQQHQGEAKDPKMKKKKAKAVKLENVIVQEYEEILANLG